MAAGTTRISTTESPTPTWTGPAAYVKSIMDPDDESVGRIDCPRVNTARFSYLRDAQPPPDDSADKHQAELKWFFAIDLRSAEQLLPRLLGSVVEVANFLGPGQSFISIVEGNSKDLTLQVLAELVPALKSAGIGYSFAHVDIDPGQGDRIGKLAALRNKALLPLTDPASRGRQFASDTDVVFLNDVAICPDDILELIHQKRQLGATMVCPLDWTYVFKDPTFYDVWISRTLAGDTFFDIPANGSWNSARDIFWNDEYSRSSLSSHSPFQVFSCWNGAAVFPATLVTGENPIRFRGPKPEECFQGEPELFCKDIWLRGLGRIAVIPSVNLEYSNEAAAKLRVVKGHVNQWIEQEDIEKNKIEWSDAPPEKVRCLPGNYARQSWRPWNEGFEAT